MRAAAKMQVKVSAAFFYFSGARGKDGFVTVSVGNSGRMVGIS